MFSYSHLRNRPSKHVEKGSYCKKGRRARGCEIKTSAGTRVEDSQSVSHNAEFEYISKPRETYSNKFKFGFSRYGDARSHRFE